MATIHVNRGGTGLGTFSEDEVRDGLRTGRFQATDLGWHEGMEGWQSLSKFPGFSLTPPPLSQRQDSPSLSLRPRSMTVISVLNFVFGGLSILAALFLVIMGNSTMMLLQEGPRSTALLVFGGVLSLGVGGVAVISGLGLTKVASWGKGWTLAYAILGLVQTGIGLLINLAQVGSKTGGEAVGAFIGAVIGGAIGCVYPAILLFFLNSAKWKTAFGSTKLASV